MAGGPDRRTKPGRSRSDDAPGGDDLGQAGQGEDDREPPAVTVLEVAASLLGLALTLGMIAFIAWEALTSPADAPPVVVVQPLEVRPAGDLWVVEFEASNLSSSTAAGVEIEGTLSGGGRTLDTARATLDYVPGKSTARGGLYFGSDPGGLDLELRALGFADP